MKKTIIAFTIILLGLNVMAQDSLLVNKNGSFILPQKGDIAVGFSANPFLNYLGNMFNGTTGNKLDLSDDLLYFRYFLKNDEAIRIGIQFDSHKDVENYYVYDDAARLIDPLSKKQVEDRVTTKSNIYSISVGYEKFRGYKKLKGFYGADLGFMYTESNTKYEWGNKMNELNPIPTTHLLVNPSIRSLEINDGAGKTISLGVFTGAEYYFMPKVCLGLEIGIRYGKTWYAQSNTKSEEMVLSQRVETELATDPGDRERDFATSFPYSFGNLYLMIHF